MKTENEIGEYEKEIIEETHDIIVITGSNCFGFEKFKEEEFWKVSIKITAWKTYLEGGILQRELRNVFANVDERKINVLRQQITDNSLIKLRVGISGNQFILVDVLESNCNDIELNTILDEQISSDCYEDTIFGEFTFNKSVKWFENTVDWMEELIHLTFDENDIERIEDSIYTAHKLFEKQSEWDIRIREYAADKFLDLKNENWSEKGRDITKKEFVNLIGVTSISVSPNGKFEFWFHDGDMFFGQSIRVQGSLEEGVTDAIIEK